MTLAESLSLRLRQDQTGDHPACGYVRYPLPAVLAQHGGSTSGVSRSATRRSASGDTGSDRSSPPTSAGAGRGHTARAGPRTSTCRAGDAAVPADVKPTEVRVGSCLRPQPLQPGTRSLLPHKLQGLAVLAPALMRSRLGSGSPRRRWRYGRGNLREAVISWRKFSSTRAFPGKSWSR